MSQRIKVQFTADQEKEIRELSKRTGASLTEIVRRAVNHYLRDIDAQGIQAVMFDSHSDEAAPTR